MMEKTCIILGTRPEVIKMSPLVRACERREGSDWFMVHMGQGCSCDAGRVLSGRLGLLDVGRMEGVLLMVAGKRGAL